MRLELQSKLFAVEKTLDTRLADQGTLKHDNLNRLFSCQGRSCGKLQLLAKCAMQSESWLIQSICRVGMSDGWFIDTLHRL